VSPTPFKLFRLRTGHCRLNSHLHRLGLHPTSNCEQCQDPETVAHFLFVCTTYQSERTKRTMEADHGIFKHRLCTTLSPIRWPSSEACWGVSAHIGQTNLKTNYKRAWRYKTRCHKAPQNSHNNNNHSWCERAMRKRAIIRFDISWSY